MLKDFREFILRGNLVDLAVAVVIGTAFGALVAALVRDLLTDEGRRKVSLRATNGRVDVSAIARGFGGGGHRQAAGFTTDVPLPELIDRLRTEIGAQL